MPKDKHAQSTNRPEKKIDRTVRPRDPESDRANTGIGAMPLRPEQALSRWATSLTLGVYSPRPMDQLMQRFVLGCTVHSQDYARRAWIPNSTAQVGEAGLQLRCTSGTRRVQA